MPDAGLWCSGGDSLAWSYKAIVVVVFATISPDSTFLHPSFLSSTMADTAEAAFKRGLSSHEMDPAFSPPMTPDQDQAEFGESKPAPRRSIPLADPSQNSTTPSNQSHRPTFPPT